MYFRQVKFCDLCEAALKWFYCPNRGIIWSGILQRKLLYCLLVMSSHDPRGPSVLIRVDINVLILKYG